jgi:hypothetical protein
MQPPQEAGPCTVDIATLDINGIEIDIYFPGAGTCSDGTIAPFPVIVFAHGFGMLAPAPTSPSPSSAGMINRGLPSTFILVASDYGRWVFLWVFGAFESKTGKALTNCTYSRRS